jgi:hypothetical protein
VAANRITYERITDYNQMDQGEYPLLPAWQISSLGYDKSMKRRIQQ